MEYDQMNLQQDALEKLCKATINASDAQNNAQRDFEKAQAELFKWTKRYELAVDANREDLIFHARHQKQRYEEIVRSFKSQKQQENIQQIEEKVSIQEAQHDLTINDLEKEFAKVLGEDTDIDNVLAAFKAEVGKQITSDSKDKLLPQQTNTAKGVAFITAGTVAGVSLSSTIGGMGLAGGFGAVGIGTVPVVCAGAITGAAAYGALQAIQGDGTALSAIAIGSIGGASVSSFVGTMGLVAPKIGLAVGIGTIPMATVGGIVGLAAYGVAKMLDETATSETPMQAFERMEEKILEMDFYSAAKQELQAFLSGEDLNPQFAAIEIEEELQALKKQILSEREDVLKVSGG